MLEHAPSTAAIFPLSVDDEARRKEAVLPSSVFANTATNPLKRGEILAGQGLDTAALSALQTGSRMTPTLRHALAAI
jgi:hypothetical protein